MCRRNAVGRKLLREAVARDRLCPRGIVETTVYDRRVLDTQRDEDGGEDHGTHAGAGGTSHERRAGFDRAMLDPMNRREVLGSIAGTVLATTTLAHAPPK